MIGIVILVIFLIFAGLMYARVVPALLAVPCMAVIMAFAARVPAHQIGNLVVTGAVSLAPVYVAVIFGALLGRVTLDTGIARAIVNLAAEYGGENPLVLALTLSAITAVLFVSLNGLGAIIMVGSIVLPIMMTSGIPRKIAATLFLMAFALGFIFNIANWKFYTSYFGVTQTQLIGFAVLLAVIDAAVLVSYAVISLRRERDYAAWSARTADDADEVRSQRVPWYALAAPVLPILLYFTLHIDAILAFALSAIYAAIAAKPREIVKTLMAAAIRGVEDVAPAIVLFIGIGVLLTMTKAPQFAQALQLLVGGSWTHNPIAFVVIFGLLSPLALYRGPLNPFGVGIAIFTVLLASHALPAVVVVAAVMAVVQVQNVCDPTNTANVWVANFTGTPIQEITKRTLPYQVAVATLACILIVLASQQLFGVRAFALAIPRIFAIPQAMADSWPGLFSPPSAANTVAIGDDGSVYAQTAADTIAQTLSGTFHVFRRTEDPNATDCTRKKYAAYITVTSTAFRLREGTDLDIGLRLEDCGGWEVTEWHDHALIAPNAAPSQWLTAEHSLALQGLTRMRDWALANPEKSTHLWANGLAYARGDRPTYYYALFKTVDGYMRAFVRAGGPAYDAGLRTNDIVDKIDGQFWWEYGTFQSQARAYDGKPHSFEVERGSQTLDFQLGEPFTPALSS